jgi:hypothetical protein
MDPEPEDMELTFDSDNGGKSEGATASESEGSDAELIGTDEATKDPVSSEEKAQARDKSLAQLQSGHTAPTRKREGKKLKMRKYVGTIEEEDGLAPKPVYQPAQATVRRRQKATGPDAVIVLKEERVCIYVRYRLLSYSCVVPGEYVPRFSQIRISTVSHLFRTYHTYVSF